MYNVSYKCGINEGQYLFARLRIDERDHECFYLEQVSDVGDGTVRETRMHYHDLNSLMVPTGKIAVTHFFKKK